MNKSQKAKEGIITRLFINMQEASYDPDKILREEKMRILANLINYMYDYDVLRG